MGQGCRDNHKFTAKIFIISFPFLLLIRHLRFENIRLIFKNSLAVAGYKCNDYAKTSILNGKVYCFVFSFVVALTGFRCTRQRCQPPNMKL